MERYCKPLTLTNTINDGTYELESFMIGKRKVQLLCFIITF